MEQYLAVLFMVFRGNILLAASGEVPHRTGIWVEIAIGLLANLALVQ